MPRPASLTLHDRDVSSVFDLLGRDENDLTAAFAFTLARSPGLLRRIVQRVAPAASYEEAVLRLEARNSDGRTDLEISAGNHLIVVEAKRGWLVPGETQLVKYAGRVTAHGNGVLVSLSAASHDWARCTLPETIQGIPVAHLPWEEVRLDLTAARIIARGQERAWLEEFADYLRKAIKMRDPADSWTYCVVVSNDRPGDGGPHTYREFVTAEASYFHPYGWGKGWPKTPPNFVAFRWNSQVQQVRRVTRAEVIPDLQSRWPGIPKTVDTIRPHALYHLGAPLPGTPIPSGTTYRAARIWVILDYLLTSSTLKEARAKTARVTEQADPHELAEDEAW